MGTSQYVGSVGLAVYKGDARAQLFELQVSADGNTWIPTYSGKTSGSSNDMEWFGLGQDARYVRIVGHKNSVNEWNSLTEDVISSKNNGASRVVLRRTAVLPPQNRTTVFSTTGRVLSKGYGADQNCPKCNSRQGKISSKAICLQ